MEYLSTKEFAAKWNLSMRQVQRLLKTGRIVGAEKISGSWIIPSDTIKPTDLRSTKLQYHYYLSFPIKVGKLEESINNVPLDYRGLAIADVAFRQGNSQTAIDYWKTTSADDETKLTASALAAAAAISSGDYALYNKIQISIDSLASKSDQQNLSILNLPKTMVMMSMGNLSATPLWLAKVDFSNFPYQLAPFLLYLHTLYLSHQKEWSAVLATARSAYILNKQRDSFTWLDLYFSMYAAMAAYSLEDISTAEHFLNQAIDLALPCGFVQPFADLFDKFGGLLEQALEQKNPDFSCAVKSLWELSSKNWITFHNQFTKASIATQLNAQEQQIAHLLVLGNSYAEIARKMNLSVGRCKNIITTIYSKLNIRKRKQLIHLVP